MQNHFKQSSKKFLGIFTFSSIALLLVFSISHTNAQDGKTWLQFEGKSGPGKGKHIVLVSGDDEYRSEEGMPMLGKLLAEHYIFSKEIVVHFQEHEI